MNDPERMTTPRYVKQEIDQYRSFLKPTLADDQDDFYGPIRPIIGPELSVAYLDKEDIGSYIITITCIQELFANGLDDLGMEAMTGMTAELKLSMSIGARVLDSIFSNKIEYLQTQNVHEYSHRPEKKGLFGGGRPPELPVR